MKENLLNRKTYKEIKKYDREQMENFLRTIYTEGFRDGVDAKGQCSKCLFNSDFRFHRK